MNAFLKNTNCFIEQVLSAAGFAECGCFAVCAIKIEPLWENKPSKLRTHMSKVNFCHGSNSLFVE